MCRPIPPNVAERAPGGVVEWLMAPVLKTGRAQALVGSNPTPSASQRVISSYQWAEGASARKAKRKKFQGMPRKRRRKDSGLRRTCAMRR